MDCFHYPLDTETLLRKKRKLRRELLARNPHPLHKKIAILGEFTHKRSGRPAWGCFCCNTASRRSSTRASTPSTGRTPCSARRSWTSSTPTSSTSTHSWRNLTALPTTADSDAAIDAMLGRPVRPF